MRVMAPHVTVIVPVAAPASLPALIRSLDAQSLAYHDFTVTYVVTESSAIRPRLESLVARRPNVAVTVVSDAEGLAIGVRTARAAVDSGWALILPALDAPLLLPPRALESLIAAGETHGARTVIGRTYTVGGPQHGRSFRQDGLAPNGLDLDDPDTALCRLEATRRDGPTVIVASYPCLAVLKTAAAAAYVVPSPAIESAVGTWSDGELTISLSGSLPADFDVAELTVEVCQPGTGQQFWLPTCGDIAQDGTFAATSRLDPATAAAGGWLGRGVWELWLSAVDGRQRSIRTRIDPPTPGGAVLGGRLLACKRTTAGLVLDVEATRHSPFRRFRIDDARLEETVRGTVLRLNATDLHVDRHARVPGQVLQDGFSLPAVLIATPEGSVVECRLSGLQGNRGISTAFGSGPPAATGLRLRIGHTGQMSVLKQSKKKPARRTDPAQVSSAQLDARHWAARLRRRVPVFLEPAVGRVARLPIARDGYRRLTRRR